MAATSKLKMMIMISMTMAVMVRLERIMPGKMSFFVRQKVQILSKSLQQIPNFASFCHAK